MKKLIVLFGVILFVSCQQQIKQDDIAKLNGYWEISSVTKIDGEKKEVKVNETIYFF